MENLRLIYEQTEFAKRHLLGTSLLDFRLALILLDNVAELLMHRELQKWFAMEDKWLPKWEPAYTEFLRAGLGPKYTPEERQAAEREFDAKTRILCLRLGRLSNDERAILNVCHKLRNEAFHRGTLRKTILEHVCRLLYITVVNMTLKFPASSFSLPGSTPDPDDASFLERFSIKDPFLLATEDGRRHLADRLCDGITLEYLEFAGTFSRDLVERIDSTLEGLEYVGETSDRSEIDRKLQYAQFWQDLGATLLKQGIREADLENAYRRWQSEGRARYTLHKIGRWRRQAEAIARCDTPAKALDHYWAIDKRLRPLEDDVFKAVFRYDEEIDMRIHERG